MTTLRRTSAVPARFGRPHVEPALELRHALFQFLVRLNLDRQRDIHQVEFPRILALFRVFYLSRRRMLELGSHNEPGPAAVAAAGVVGGRVGDRSGTAMQVLYALRWPSSANRQAKDDQPARAVPGHINLQQ
jgi:hypothetical protein